MNFMARMLKNLVRGFLLLLLCVVSLFFSALSAFAATDPCVPFQATLTREAQAVYGLNAPIPMFAGQIKQESACRPGVTAWDNGRGLAQFMDGTSKQIVATFPELGPANPYNAQWAIRALVRYDGWIYKRMKGNTPCDTWAAALKGYNAGPGYVMRAQAKSPTPGVWFGATEYINAGQSAVNFEYSRTYPRKILLNHQKGFISWGTFTCGNVPIDHPMSVIAQKK